MRRFAIVVAGLFSMSGFPGSASAADLPASTYRNAPAAAPTVIYNWTGCYVGGHRGVV